MARGSLQSISLDGGEVDVLNEFAEIYRLHKLPEPFEVTSWGAVPDVGFTELPIASPVIEALPALPAMPPDTTSALERGVPRPTNDVADDDNTADAAAEDTAAEIDDVVSSESRSLATPLIALGAATVGAALAVLAMVVYGYRRR